MLRRKKRKTKISNDLINDVLAEHEFMDGPPIEAVVIDDDPNFLRLIAGHFKRLGVNQVYLFDHEYEALNHISQRVPDILAIDVQLKQNCDFDGFHVLRMVRDLLGFDLPTLVVSADPDNSIRVEKESHAHVSRFLNKPVAKQELMNQVFGLLTYRSIRLAA